MLSKISAKNFMSWKDLTFNVTKGATLVDGWNDDDQRSEGSGKSAILNCISWCIFGKIPKEANVDDVIKDGETSCVVVLEFDNGDAIVRSRKPNDIVLVKSGVTIKGKDARETQAFIEEYVGCNFETFCQSVYFAQNYDKKFLSSNQEEKGKILSSIQNLQIFDKARKETMDLLKNENDKLTKLESQVQVEQNNVNNFTSQKAMMESFIKDKIQKHNQQVTMINQQKSLLEGHVQRTMTDIQNINQRVLQINAESLDKDLNDLNQAKSEFTTTLANIKHKLGETDSIKKTILAKEQEGKVLANKYNNLLTKKQNLTNIETNNHYLSLLSQRQKYAEYDKSTSHQNLLKKKSDLEAYILNPTKTCPSCGTELKNIDLSHTQAELSSIDKQINDNAVSSAEWISNVDKDILTFTESFKRDQEGIDGELSNVLKQLEVLSEYLDQNKIPSVEDLINQENQIKDTISQIDKAVSDTHQKKMEYSRLLDQHLTLGRQLTDYSTQLENCNKNLTSIGEPDVKGDYSRLEVIGSELSNAQVKVSELQNIVNQSKAYIDKLEALKEGFKEIKSYVFTNALNELNFRTNQYLNELFDMEATIKFSNEDQKIESKIVINGNERSLGLLSGGQNRRFNLAVDLALADIVSYRKTSKLDLIIFDEYFKDLSEISMEKSLNLLKDRKCPVILIEHNSIFKNIVDNTFFVRLQNGTSHESRP